MSTIAAAPAALAHVLQQQAAVVMPSSNSGTQRRKFHQALVRMWQGMSLRVGSSAGE